MLSTRVHDNLVFQSAIKRPWVLSFGVSISQSKIGTFEQVSASFGFSKGLFPQFSAVLVRSWSCRCVYTKRLDSTYITYLLTYYYLLLSYLFAYELTSCCFHLPTTTGDCQFRHLVAWLVPVRTQSQAPVSRFNVSSPITGGGHITLQTPPYPKEMCFHWDKRPIQSTGSLQSWGSKWTPDPLPAAIG